MRLRTEIAPGFVCRDEVAGHVLACGDASSVEFVGNLVSTLATTPNLLLADPPYGVSSEKEIRLVGRKAQFLSERWDLLTEAELADLLDRVASLARDLRVGNAWIWTSDWWVSNVKRSLRDAGLSVWPTYVWCKPNPAQSVRKRCLASACEYLVMASGPQAIFDLDALPRQRNWFVSDPDGTFRPAVSPGWVERAVVSQAERLAREDGSDSLNRAQKPLDVTEALVRAGAPEGGLVLDLFGGTGTALIAADRAKRRCVYVERDPVQVRAAASRLLLDRRERA